jgi:hypothetical protein
MLALRRAWADAVLKPWELLKIASARKSDSEEAG